LPFLLIDETGEKILRDSNCLSVIWDIIQSGRIKITKKYHLDMNADC
jgi:hypothetical protein